MTKTVINGLPQMTKEEAEVFDVPWGEVGYIVFKRTYARKLSNKPGDNTTEEFHQMVERCITAFRTQLKCVFTEFEENEIRYYMMHLKMTVAGRFMWQLGSKTVSKLGLMSLQNCAFTSVNHPIDPFTWTFDDLMLGSGVGFSIERENIYQLPKLPRKKVVITRHDANDADYIVPDTREGWVKLLGKVLKAHFYSGEGFTYSVQLVRSHGAPIGGFGGRASGPEVLCEGMAEISNLLNARRGNRITSVDALDIMNILGMIAIAGNTRRSAEIATGDYDDIDFLMAKNWASGDIPKWRSNSNNSVICDDISKLPKEFWAGYDGSGEPYGLINLKLMRTMGRTGETQYPDPNIEGVNPCLHGDMIVSTSIGDITIRDLVERFETEDIQILSKNINQDILEMKNLTWAAKTRIDAELIMIELDSGQILKLTPDHKVYTANRGYVEAVQLLDTDEIIVKDS